MGRFLRDEFVKNISVDEKALMQISHFFQEKENEINISLGNMATQREKVVYLTFIIRFDKKGYRFHDFDDVIKCYREAHKVERVIFTLESTESSGSNRLVGTVIELRLDAKDKNNTNMTISSDDRNLVDASFANLSELVGKLKNNNHLIRNNWTQFAIQIIGVVTGFIVSLWAAIKLAPHLKIQTPFVFSFLFIFLVFSNTWGYLNQQILNLINFCFPNLRFERRSKDAIHWILQALIGGITIAILLFLLGKIFSYVGEILNGLVM